jgi:rubrerythrin
MVSLLGGLLGVVSYVVARLQGRFSLAATLATGFGWLVALPAAAYGAWIAESFGSIMVIPGRPGARTAEPRETSAAALWAWTFRTEQESVAAFQRLARELEALSAPSELVERCQEAAREEQGHAAMARAMAERLGVSVELAPEDLPARAPSRAVVARESLVDGILGEGFAARIARLGAETAQEPELRAVLGQIAREEESHAVLAQDLVSWAASQGDPEVHLALASARLPWPTTPWRGDGREGRVGGLAALRCAARAHREAERARRRGLVQCRQDLV